ncbi:MAG: TonB-dependent receptor [Ferruginibacter sp.]|nr:TonB-dependent receptor [Ferruginibacter sp.]
MTINVSANGYSQDITLRLSDTPLEKVLNEIRKQTGYAFFYKTDLLKDIPKIKVKVKHASIEETMKICLSDLPLSYSIIDKTIVLSAKITRPEEKIEEETPLADIKVTGEIKTEAGLPLAGASVKLKGSTLGTSTDVNGRFTLSIPAAGGILEISFVGYNPYEIAVKKDLQLSIALKQKDSRVEEVVVIGYGTVKRTDLTGAVSSVSAEKVTQVKGVSTLAQALQGQAAGVQVIQRSGQPGEGVSIKIRGTNSIQAGNDPLYVVDGLPLDFLSAQLNPADIESIEVLKDASSTAIYGSRGANGVIMITTKKGKEGKSRVSYNGYYGTQSLRKKVDLINAREYANLQNEVAVNDGQPLKWTPAQIDSLAPKGIDWQDLIYRNAPVQNHDLSVSGGSAGTKFYTSFGYFDQDGIIESSYFKRFSFRGNLEQKINEKLTSNISLSLQQSNYFQNNYFNADGGGGVPFTTMVMPPTQPIYDANGRYSVFTGVPWGQTNPYGISKEEYRPNKALRLIGNVTLSYAIVKGLKLKLSAGIDNNRSTTDYYAPSTLSLYNGGGAFKNLSNSSTFVNENLLNYNTNFNKHTIDAVAGITYQSSKSENLNSGTFSGFLTDIYRNNNLAAATVKPTNTNSGYSDNKLISYLGRVNYTFAGKYLLTLTGRVDGSSKFTKNDKYAFFPSGAVGWRVSEESFMQSVKAVSNLKLRASFGVSGNQAIGPYQSLGRLGTQNVTFNNNATTTYLSSQLENGTLKWEETSQLDLGIDLGLFNERLQLTADYYDKKTTDLLLDVSLPGNTGYTSILKNLGATGNKGFEFLLNGRILTGRPLTWSSTLTFTSNKTRLIDLGKDAQGKPIIYKEVGSGGNWFPMILGNSMQQLFGYKVIGVYQTDAEAIKNGEPTKKAGNYKFQDTDGSGVVDGNDRIVLTRFEPKFTYGFNNNFTFNNFNLSFLIVGSYGNDISNEFRKYNITLNGKWTPSREAYNNRWVSGKGVNMFDKPSANSGNDIRDYASSLWLEDGSYLRVRDITLAYDFTPALVKRLKISSLQLYISAQNLITITNYSGYDPEVANSSATINGWDRGNYPSTKSITGGVKVNF